MTNPPLSGAGVQQRPLTCVWPRSTRAVSVTGTECQLGCAHCGGHYLTTMTDLRRAAPGEVAPEGEVKSLLVSGGCDRGGRVPFAGQVDRLKALAGKVRLNAHPGLVDEAGAAELAEWADVASFDFVGDPQTLREVYGLDATPEDYLAALGALSAHLPTVPHVCLGLNGGDLGPEFRALAMLAEAKVSSLAMLVFLPTPGTRFAFRTPPPVEEVARFFAEARARLPEAQLILGCMRPRGSYREAIDLASVEAGVDVIVQPTPAARRRAEELGRELVEFDECCAFLFSRSHSA